MNIWHDINPNRVTKDHFISCVEIPKGSKLKYEMDKETGLIMLDRILYTSTHYPANYGFIPRTYADDKDPLDVLILGDFSFCPMSLIRCKPIGVVKMIDNSEIDEKIIAVCENDPAMNCYNDIKELPLHLFAEIKHFFTVYKQLEEKKATLVTEILGCEEAKKSIEAAIKAYSELFIQSR